MAVVSLVVSAGCDAGNAGSSSSGDAAGAGGVGGLGGGASTGGDNPGGFMNVGGDPSACRTPAMAAGAAVVLAPDYASEYQAFDLGAVPGVPDALGGCVILHSDDDTLLIAGGAEGPNGAIYAIELERGPCGHIISFVGSASQIAATPYVDANLAYGPGDLLFYTRWPLHHLAQLPSGDNAPARDTDLTTVTGYMSLDNGPGGVGFVPPPLGSAGELRMITWPDGHWWHVDLQPDGALFLPTAASETAQLQFNPGGFAYVPAGSPGFPTQSLIVAEWRTSGTAGDRVATYEVNDAGDPLPATRKEFFSSFPRPWGAYFEPVTGDYIFLTYDDDTPPDRVFIVQGFAPPPPPPQ